MAALGVLTIWDLVIFSAALLLYFVIGIFFAVKERHSQSRHEFYLGSRRIPIIPAAFSLVSCAVSGITILVYPSEVYTKGTGIVWTTIGLFLALLLVAVLIIPTLYRAIPSISLYQYIEERFESKLLRLYTAALFMLATNFTLAVVLYIPVTATLSQAAAGEGESDMTGGVPTWAVVNLLGVACTLYTSIGGLKAVIWTDTVQCIVTYAGLIAVICKAVIDVGGTSRVWELAENHSRFDGFLNINPDPITPHCLTVWTGLFGGMLFWMGVFGANQVPVQRYLSMRSKNSAMGLALLSIPLIVLICGLCYLLGIVMVAYYANFGCDPLETGVRGVASKDHLVAYFITQLFRTSPGLSGLFLAALFSASLSWISSGINSMSIIAWDELLEPFIFRVLRRNLPSEKNITWITKILCLVCGLSVVGQTFSIEPLGGIYESINTAGSAICGPILGLILLGIFVPWANFWGALIGVIFGSLIPLWLYLGTKFYSIPESRLPSLGDQCLIFEIKNTSATMLTRIERSVPAAEHVNIAQPLTLESVPWEARIYAISPYMYPLLGFLPCFILGALVSLCTGRSDVLKRKPELLFWGMNPDDNFQELRCLDEEEGIASHVSLISNNRNQADCQREEDKEDEKDEKEDCKRKAERRRGLVSIFRKPIRKTEISTPKLIRSTNKRVSAGGISTSGLLDLPSEDQVDEMEQQDGAEDLTQSLLTSPTAKAQSQISSEFESSDEVEDRVKRDIENRIRRFLTPQIQTETSTGATVVREEWPEELEKLDLRLQKEERCSQERLVRRVSSHLSSLAPDQEVHEITDGLVTVSASIPAAVVVPPESSRNPSPALSSCNNNNDNRKSFVESENHFDGFDSVDEDGGGSTLALAAIKAMSKESIKEDLIPISGHTKFQIATVEDVVEDSTLQPPPTATAGGGDDNKEWDKAKKDRYSKRISLLSSNKGARARARSPSSSPTRNSEVLKEVPEQEELEAEIQADSTKKAENSMSVGTKQISTESALMSPTSASSIFVTDVKEEGNRFRPVSPLAHPSSPLRHTAGHRYSSFINPTPATTASQMLSSCGSNNYQQGAAAYKRMSLEEISRKREALLAPSSLAPITFDRRVSPVRGSIDITLAETPVRYDYTASVHHSRRGLDQIIPSTPAELEVEEKLRKYKERFQSSDGHEGGTRDHIGGKVKVESEGERQYYERELPSITSTADKTVFPNAELIEKVEITTVVEKRYPNGSSSDPETPTSHTQKAADKKASKKALKATKKTEEAQRKQARRQEKLDDKLAKQQSKKAKKDAAGGKKGKGKAVVIISSDEEGAAINEEEDKEDNRENKAPSSPKQPLTPSTRKEASTPKTATEKSSPIIVWDGKAKDQELIEFMEGDVWCDPDELLTKEEKEIMLDHEYI